MKKKTTKNKKNKKNKQVISAVFEYFPMITAMVEYLQMIAFSEYLQVITTDLNICKTGDNNCLWIFASDNNCVWIFASDNSCLWIFSPFY